MRQKPPIEIITYIIKRSRLALLHAKDRIRLVFGEITLSDEDFFKKICLSNPELAVVNNAVLNGDYESAKIKFVEYMNMRKKPLHIYSMNELNIINNSDLAADIIRQAEKILKHQFDLLGNSICFTKDIDWHFSISDKSWPLTFSPNVDYMSTRRLGDIKVPWELNRFQHLYTLGAAYFLTHDSKYANEFSLEISSWIKNNPYKVGINWMEGIEVAIRLISWSWAYQIFYLDDTFKNIHFDFLKSIYLQTKYIELHISDKWQINNNHIIAEASGLITMAVLFPEFKESPKWLKKGCTILQQELKKQIIAGFTWEYSFGYHKFVLDLILMSATVMKKNNIPIPRPILEKIQEMTSFLQAITMSNGLIPLIGDDDDGRAYKYLNEAYRSVFPTISLASYVLSSNFDLKCEMLNETNGADKELSKIFYENGVVVSKTKNIYLALTVGPQKAKYLHSSHKHLDELSFVMEAYGTEFIIDPGTYTYLGDFNWRKYFKSRKSHNTIVIDDEDPIKIKEVFEALPKKFGYICGYSTSEDMDWLAARYVGYGSINHIRHVFHVKHDYVLIVDVVEGTGLHTCDSYLHLNHHDNNIDQETKTVLSKSTTGASLKIVTFMDNDLTVELLEGWKSSAYGKKQESQVLRFRKKGSLPIFFVTVLLPFKKEDGRIKQDLKIENVFITEFGGRQEFNCQIALGFKKDFFRFYIHPLDSKDSVSMERKYVH